MSGVDDEAKATHKDSHSSRNHSGYAASRMSPLVPPRFGVKVQYELEVAAMAEV